MTIDRLTTMPPRWAESLLRLLLNPADRESVSGDLLEQYRDTIVPARGHKAGRWYVKQVAGFLWRVSWPWGALIGATLLVRDLVDLLAPIHYTPGIVPPRGRIMSDALFATWALAGFWNTWRSGHVRTGVLIAFTAEAIGGVLSIAGAAALLAMWHDPDTLWAWQNSGGLDEALWAVPLLLQIPATICGTAGAIVGKCLSTVTRWPLRRAA